MPAATLPKRGDTVAYGSVHVAKVSPQSAGVTERPELRDQVGMNTTTRAQLASKLNTLEMGIAPLTRQADERAHNQRTTIPKEWK